MLIGLGDSVNHRYCTLHTKQYSFTTVTKEDDKKETNECLERDLPSHNW